MKYLTKFKNTITKNVLKPTWITNSSNELGIRILNINFWYYKDSTPIIGTSDDNSYWRPVTKREFGEVIHSVKPYTGS